MKITYKILLIISLIFITNCGKSQTTSYGLWYNNIYHNLAEVNILSGQMNLINNSNNIEIIYSETAFINPDTNQYIFKGRYQSSNIDRYFALDINTGSILSDTPASDDIRMLQFHPLTDSVFGLWYNSTNNTHYLANVDILTGQMTVISNSSNIGIVYSETAFINPNTNQYIFKGRYQSSNVDRYFALDINTGSILSDTIASDDIRMLKFYFSNTNSIKKNNAIKYNIFPNPFIQTTSIKIKNLDYKEYSLYVYDYQGKLIQHLSNVNSSKIEINGNNLNSGIYFFKLLLPDSKMITGKIIKK